MEGLSPLEVQLTNALEKRKQTGLFRSLKYIELNHADFSSNDYLGLARSRELTERIEYEMTTANFCKNQYNGATGSRLLSGNHRYYTHVEDYLSKFYKRESALIFNSGYDANLGVLSSLPQSDSLILYDELIHNSVHAGIRLSRAKSASFQHNNYNDLISQIKQYENLFSTIFIVIESIYSMDGDESPLIKLAELCKSPKLHLIVDEAHGVGTRGPHGSGLVCELNLESQVFCSIYTFGKAMGIHGAVVCGNRLLKEYLLNYSRPLIYSTALPVHSLASIKSAHDIISKSDYRRIKLSKLIQKFNSVFDNTPELTAKLQRVSSSSAIQAIIIPGNHYVTQASEYLNSSGFSVFPIRSPTVPTGLERLRVILHFHNTEAEIEDFIQTLSNWINKEYIIPHIKLKGKL